MSKAPSPLLGYNNNVRHKNKIFHIQTEDSGVKYGHIITHLFMDGGRILKSVKTSYTEYLGNEKMADIVREMMKQQHKSLFIALRDGKFDHLVEGADISQQTKALTAAAAAAVAAAVAPTAVAPTAPVISVPVPTAPADAAAPAPVVLPRANVDATEKVAAMPAIVLTPPPMQAPPPIQAPATSAPKPVAPRATAPQPAQARRTTPTRVNAVPMVTRSATPPPPDTTRRDTPLDSPSTERNPHELTLDIDALERAAAATETSSPVFKPASDLPPPPTNLFREKTTTGKYRTLPPPGTGASGSSPPGAPTPPPRPAVPNDRRAASVPPTASPTASSNANAPKRYAPTRPAAIFGQGRPAQGKTVFGEDLISDKSLDEVILSYLADDLEPPPKK